MSEGMREVETTDANGTTRSVGGRVVRPVTSGVAYNCSGTQFLVPGIASGIPPKHFGSGFTAPSSRVLRLPRKYARNIIPLFQMIFSRRNLCCS